MKKITSVFCSVLCSVAIAVSMLVPAAAFSDVTDESASKAISTLSSLGIISGYDDGLFHPEDYLTRSQFCKMVITAKGLDSSVSTASKKLLFNDVTPSHWAYMYISEAYQNNLISGYGNGYFGPDDTITYAQVITILLRTLGYSSTDIGKYWPDDYISFAKEIGIDTSDAQNPDSPVSRQEAAMLVYQALTAKTKSGKYLFDELADTVIGSAILLGINETSPAGVENCVKIGVNGSSSYYSNSGGIADTSMIGNEGKLLLNDEGEAICFVATGDSYRIVSGILVSTGDYENRISYVKIYSDNSIISYPESSEISKNSVGQSGSLLLNKNNGAVAFISDRKGVYTINTGAGYIADGVVSYEGVENCSKFIIGGNSVYYSSEAGGSINGSVGDCGTVITDSDGNFYAFVKDSGSYGEGEGILLKIEDKSAVFLVNGEIVTKNHSGGLSQSDIGRSGLIICNSSGYVSGFAADRDSPQYTVYTDAVFLNDPIPADSWYYATGNVAVFMVNGQIKYYPIPAKTSVKNKGYSGYLIINEDGTLNSFIGESKKYSVFTGTVRSVGTDQGISYIAFLEDGDTSEMIFYTIGNVSAKSGNYGMIFINSSGYAEYFVSIS